MSDELKLKNSPLLLFRLNWSICDIWDVIAAAVPAQTIKEFKWWKGLENQSNDAELILLVCLKMR